MLALAACAALSRSHWLTLILCYDMRGCGNLHSGMSGLKLSNSCSNLSTHFGRAPHFAIPNSTGGGRNFVFLFPYYCKYVRNNFIPRKITPRWSFLFPKGNGEFWPPLWNSCTQLYPTPPEQQILQYLRREPLIRFPVPTVYG